MGLFGQPMGPGLSRVRPRVLSEARKMAAPVSAYYVLTKTQATLPNSRLHPNTGTPNYDIKHEVSDISDIDTSYLAIDGSNANQNVDIGSYSLTTAQVLAGTTTRAAKIYEDGATSTIIEATGSLSHINLDLWAKNNGAVRINFGGGANQPLVVSDGATVAANWITIAPGLITDTSGTISFSDENIKTTGDISIAADSSKLQLGASNDLQAYHDGVDSIITTPADLKISSTAGTLKLEPDAQGDVILFGDTDVADTANGKSFYVYRKAAEGDDYFRIYVDQWRQAWLKGSLDLFFEAGAGRDIILNAGAEGDIRVFRDAQAGDNPSIKQAGYITAAANEVEIWWTVKDTDDYFWLERENTNILGFKIDMPVDLVDNNLTTTGTIDWSGATHMKPKIYAQATEPDIANDSFAFWKDTDDNSYWLVLDIGGTQKKVQLT